jgi:hypothetical protein
MTRHNTPIGIGAFGPEPERDHELGALLREVTGSPPMQAVDWSSLARRVAGAISLDAQAPWWSYAYRWERRAIPLALAAGIMGAVALWSASTSAISIQVSENPEFMSAVVSGAPAADAARSFARSVTGSADFNIEAPE